MGLDGLTTQFLPIEAKPLINDLFPTYERWMKARTGSEKCLSRFIALLCNKAAKEIRLNGLAIVALELRDIDYSDYYHKDQISTYSYFLTTIWQENQAELRENKIAMANFQQILNGLIAVQDARSLELAAQVNATRN